MPSEAPAVMSVFDIDPRFIGGTETYARELSLQLGQYGWRSVLCFVAPPPEDVGRFLILPNVSFELVDFVRSPKVRVLGQLAKVLRRQAPKVVHFHYTDFLSPYAWLARLLAAEQVFFTDHSSGPANHTGGRASLLKRCIARAITWPLSHVFSVSNYGYRRFTEHGLFPEDLCRMIYNGVDLSRVAESEERGRAFRRRFGIPGERQVVLQVSWIIPEKGVLDLLAAARVVVSQNPTVHFVIVGDGSFREEYMNKAIELGLRDHVTWTGLVGDPFTAGVYDAADILCQPSRWEEVFGWVIVEAMAYRKPVIATRVGGIPELVVDEDSGFLIERGDVKKLAEKVLALIQDPARGQLMGMAGRRIVDAKFDLRKNVGQLLEAYGIRDRESTA
jgi:glycosyltransferase involved in cell wall biosynthesis